MPSHRCHRLLTTAAAVLLSGGLLAGPAPAASQPEDPPPETDSGEVQSGSRVRRLGDSLVVDPESEWMPGQGLGSLEEDLGRKLDVADRALANGDLVRPRNANALFFYRQVLEQDRDNARARDGVRRVADALMARALDARRRGADEQALAALDQLRDIQPNYPGMRTLESQIRSDRQLARLLAEGQARLEAGALNAPPGESAVDAYRAALEVEAENAAALAGLEAVETAILVQARAAMEQGDLQTAAGLLDEAETIRGGSDAVAALSADLAQTRRARRETALAAVEADIAAGSLDAAEAGLAALAESGYPQDSRSAALEQEIRRLRRVQAYPPGSSLVDPLRDGSPGPEMTVIGAGVFEMGSPPGEEGRSDSEGPQREIRFALPFALARTETTVAQFRRFVEATGHVTDAEQSGASTIYNVLAGSLKEAPGVDWRSDFQGQPARDEDPVVHVSWNDARAYARWLSEETGQSYRLPSEAEFEYALRAGSEAPYWWGEGSPEEPVENLTGDGDRMAGRWEWPRAFRRYDDGHWGPAPVGSFAPNPFGLHDMGGNVLEWAADCFRPDLAALPADGRALAVAGCEARSLRGGAWALPPERSRSAHRSSAGADRSTCLLGFRLARDL